MQQFATRPLSISTVWRSGLKLSRACFFPLYLVFLIPQLMTLIAEISTGSYSLLLVNFKTHPGDAVLFLLVSGIISILIYTFAFHQLGSYLQGSTAKISSSISFTLKKFPVVLLASIISVLVVALGLVVLIVPGIFIGLALFFYYPAILIDNLSPVQALKYTLTLIWGNWWRSVFVIFAPMFIIALMLSVLVFLGVFLAIILLHKTPEQMYLVRYFIDVVMVLVHSYISILLLSIQLIQWNDLKVRKQIKAA